MMQRNSKAGRLSVSEYDELTERINKLNIDRDVRETRAVMRRILAMSNSDADVAQKLGPSVVKLLASSDLITKKLSAWFVARHLRRHPDRFLLAINTLVKDTADPSPLIRCLSLKTIASVGEQFLHEYALPAVLRGLKDSSPSVRRVAVLACARLASVSRETVLEAGVVDSLYAMIRDSDPIVVVDSLCALEELLEDEGGVVVNRNIARYIVDRLQSFPERSLPYILTILSKYKPSVEDRNDIVYLLNALDPFLKSSSPAVVLLTTRYFRLLARQGSPGLDRDVVERVKEHLMHTLGATGGDPESAFLLLEFIEDLLHQHTEVFTSYHRVFFCRDSDPVYLKLKKITILGKVVAEDCLAEVIDELGLYCRSVSVPVTRASLSVLGHLAGRYPSAASKPVVDVCSNLLDRQIAIDKHSPTDSNTAQGADIVGDIMDVLETIDLTSLSDRQRILAAIEQWCMSLEGGISSSTSSKCASLAILAQYGTDITTAPYILERYVDELRETDGCASDVLLDCCLTAAMSLFVHRPAECQETLGAVLEMCCASKCADLRDRATLYYHLLRTDVKLVRELI